MARLKQIGHFHVVHHFFPKISFYHAEEATEYLKDAIGPYYMHSSKPVFRTLWDNYKSCLFVDDEGSAVPLEALVLKAVTTNIVSGTTGVTIDPTTAFPTGSVTSVTFDQSPLASTSTGGVSTITFDPSTELPTSGAMTITFDPSTAFPTWVTTSAVDADTLDRVVTMVTVDPSTGGITTVTFEPGTGSVKTVTVDQTRTTGSIITCTVSGRPTGMTVTGGFTTTA